MDHAPGAGWPVRARRRAGRPAGTGHTQRDSRSARRIAHQHPLRAKRIAAGALLAGMCTLQLAACAAVCKRTRAGHAGAHRDALRLMAHH